MGSCLDDDGVGGTSLTNINQVILLMEMQRLTGVNLLHNNYLCDQHYSLMLKVKKLGRISLMNTWDDAC
jgi:hypothetical protein